jgi:hypothetical protein
MHKHLILGMVVWAAVGVFHPQLGLAWGDEGHEIVALIAQNYLAPAVRARVTAMLSADPDPLTPHDIASEAVWADRYKDTDRNSTKVRYNGTFEWHFINIEVARPSLDQACYGHPPLPFGMPASQGPPHACIVDKINQFIAELANPVTSNDERLLALKFLLHLVGDVHQPLHTADDRDAGGNQKRVAAPGYPDDNLHFYWDVPFVQRLGLNARSVAARLAVRISCRQAQRWSSGTAASWALESFRLGRYHAYAMLPAPSAAGIYSVPPAYLRTAIGDVTLQLKKAGVRLAFVLNHALGTKVRSIIVEPNRICAYRHRSRHAELVRAKRFGMLHVVGAPRCPRCVHHLEGSPIERSQQPRAVVLPSERPLPGSSSSSAGLPQTHSRRRGFRASAF